MHQDRAQELYLELKKGRHSLYNEEVHCPMLLRVMMSKGRVSAFCVEALIGETTFYDWVNKHELFAQTYWLGRNFAREAWEKEGEEIRDEMLPPGSVSYRFEHWRMIGWSRFGVSKNSRIRLDLDPKAAPNEHYSQLLAQAKNGDFTSGEIKQLMEAINVGMSAHQTFKLQQEIDQLKFDLTVMTENSNADNRLADQRATKKD